jgi:uncharacterized membrane protein
MALMALDHSREFLTNVSYDPLDVTQTNVFLYATRWVTHLCAPTFVFLAGVGAYLAGRRGRTPAQLSQFLVTRGLWLAFLDFTFIWWFGWDFSLATNVFAPQVIWAIGISMILLAGLIWLPRHAVFAAAIGMILGHNLLDGVKPEAFGRLSPVWQIIHAGGEFNIGDVKIVVYYPLLPWPGVMALGFCIGPWLMDSEKERRRRLIGTGLAALMAFVLLRGLNLYGDPKAWTRQPSALHSVMAALNCEKYPPSLDYLLMTLGAAFLLLASLDRIRASWTNWLVTFGRVPLFFYLLHLPLIHGIALAIHALAGRPTSWLFSVWSNTSHWPGTAPGRGFGLPVIYAAWLLAIALLYPVCRWFAGVKARRRDWWLGYL